MRGFAEAMSTKVDPILTVADLNLLPDDHKRYELFEGEIFVSRDPSLSHQVVLDNLVTLLKNFLSTRDLGRIWSTPGVIFDGLNAAMPDIAFVANEHLAKIVSGDKITGAPDLMIEILSEGAENVRRDRVVKRQVYGKFGVSEYWIVDRFERTIEIYQLQEEQLLLVATLREDDVLTSASLPGLSFEVCDVFNE